MKKKATTAIILTVFGFVIAYLMVAFVVWEFNVEKMSEPSRFVIILIGIVFAVPSNIAALEN